MSAPLRRSFKIEKIQRRDAVEEGGRKLGRFEGFLAVYGNRDFYDSMLKAGCFTKSLNEKQWYPLLADHDPSKPMGRFRCEDTDFGLKIFAEVFLDIGYAADKWIALTGEAIDGLSVGFSIVKREYDEEKELLTILEARLWEGSVVTFPANDLARVESLRALPAGTRRVTEQLLTLLAEATNTLPEELALSAAGDKPMSVRVERILQGLEEKIEALRAAAASPVTEPLQQHSAGQQDQEVADLLQRVKDFKL